MPKTEKQFKWEWDRDKYDSPAEQRDGEQITKLRAALESIAKNTCCDGCQEAARVAAGALK